MPDEAQLFVRRAALDGPHEGVRDRLGVPVGTAARDGAGVLRGVFEDALEVTLEFGGAEGVQDVRVDGVGHGSSGAVGAAGASVLSVGVGRGVERCGKGPAFTLPSN